MDDGRRERGVVAASDIAFVQLVLGKCFLHVLQELVLGDGLPDGIVLQSIEISDSDGDGLLDELFQGVDLQSFQHFLGLSFVGADVTVELSESGGTSMSVGAREAFLRTAKKALLLLLRS